MINNLTDAIQNMTFNGTTNVLGSPFITVEKCEQICGDFKLQVASTMNTRLWWVLTIIAFALLIRVFSNIYDDKKPEWVKFIERRVDVLLLCSSLFLIGYLLFF